MGYTFSCLGVKYLQNYILRQVLKITFDRKTTGLLTTGLLTTGHVTTGLLDNWSFGQLVLLTIGLLDNWTFRQLVFWTTGLLPNWSRRPVPKRPVV